MEFKYILALLLLWLFCSTPLVLIGSFIGAKAPTIKNPCRVNALPSTIPPQSSYMKTKFLMFSTGMFAFSAIFIELFSLMSSLWHHQYYFLFGLMICVFASMLIISSEVAILVTYWQLSKLDYRWWWKSFFVSGSVAIYIFGYSIYYFFFQLNIVRLSSFFFYFGYMLLFSVIIFLVTGSFGFLCTYYFLRKIYSMIKID